MSFSLNTLGWVLGFVVLVLIVLRSAKKNPKGFKEGMKRIGKTIMGDNSKNKSEDIQETIRYRGQEYEIDNANRRFIKVQPDGKGGFKSTPVKLPFHIWIDVFGEEEPSDGDDYY